MMTEIDYNDLKELVLFALSRKHISHSKAALLLGVYIQDIDKLWKEWEVKNDLG